MGYICCNENVHDRIFMVIRQDVENEKVYHGNTKFEQKIK